MSSRVVVNIYGTDYTIAAEESEEYVRKVAQMVDKRMRELAVNLPSASSMAAGVLVAVDLADALLKAEASADNMRAQLKKYLDDYSRASSKEEESRHEVARLRAEIEELKDQLIQQDGQQTL